jgi:hypothetical protein
MALPAPLPQSLRKALGPEAGDELMTWLQEMRAEAAQSRQEMVAAIQASELRMVERINQLEVRLIDRISKVDVHVADAKADLMKWSFVFWVGAVAAIALLAGVLNQ